MTQFITIMGVKDRVGASTFAKELALHFKKKGMSVLLLDADPFYVGDLAHGLKWKTLKELERIPLSERQIDPNWLQGYLKNEAGVPSLALASERLELQSFNPDSIFASIKHWGSSFDWILLDAGSRWHKLLEPMIHQSTRLLFVMHAAPDLVTELKRKGEDLIQSHFPLKKAGWVSQKSGTSDNSGFLNVDSISEFSKIDYMGQSVEEVFLELQSVAAKPDLKKEEKEITNEELLGIKWRILQQVQEKMETKGLKGEKQDEELKIKVSKIIFEVLEEEMASIPKNCDRSLLSQELLDELLGLGPLEKLLKDSQYSEVLVNGTGAIYVEEKGRLQKTPFEFLNADSLGKVIERILLPLGRRVDESSPMVDARLKEGSRVNIILPPLALEGPCISIRRFSGNLLTPADLIERKAASEEMFQFLEAAVQSKKNILVSGGTGSGKTTLLNVLSSFIPKDERILTIEDAAELKLNQPHVVRLESRPANIEGKGAITIRDLVRNALRMRPDRIVIGECRGGEALDMLQAMNTGHEGSLTTLHANTPRDALARLETLVMFSGMELPSRVIREQIASAIDLIVQVARLAGGERKIVQISKMCGLEGNVFVLQDLFAFEADGFQNVGSYL